MKLFRIEDNDRGHRIYHILGIKISLKKKLKPKQPTLIEMQQEIKMLRNIMDCCIDITKVPPAKGKVREIQLEIFELLKRVKKVCEQNNLNYWLDSGTLLGAVRHRGYIPWDSDIDICMPREDFEKVLLFLKKEFENTDYVVRERAKTVNNFQIRIMRSNKRAIGMDIFPVDKYNKSKLTKQQKIRLTERIKQAQKVFNKKYPQKPFPPELVPQAKRDILKVQSEIILRNEESTCENPMLFFGIDYPHAYNMLAFDYETVFPLGQITFEGEMFNCPNDYDTYLRTFYGDYMRLPNKVSYE